jgi:hypothetical protein
MRELNTYPDSTPDVADQALKLGLNRVEATMVVPYMWVTPGTSDPYSPVVIAIVTGLQNGLAELGIATRGDGFVDHATAEAMKRLFGSRWKSKPWTQLYSEMSEAMDRGPSAAKESAMGTYIDLGDLDRSQYNFTSKGTAFGIGATHGLFVDMQKQLNRVASLPGAGFGKIGTDGKIGTNTIAAVQAAERFLGLSIVPAHTQAGIAQAADRLRDEFKYQADQRGAAASVSAPLLASRAGGGSGAVIRDVTTGTLTVSKAGFVGDLMTPTGLALAGFTVVGLWYLSQQDKKRKPAKRKATKRKPAARRRTRRRPKRRTTTTWF